MGNILTLPKFRANLRFIFLYIEKTRALYDLFG